MTILTQGTTVTVEDGAAGTATIGGITAMSGIGSGAATEIDTTNLASTRMESRPGLKDNGSFTMDLQRDEDDAGQAELLEMIDGALTREFVIVLSSSTLKTLTFDGYVTSLTTDVAANGIVTGQATIKITGAVVRS